MSSQNAAQDDGQAPDHRRGRRIEAAVVLVLAAGVLIVAQILQPAAEGYGTHEQLFIIPCAFRWITGLPCPMCGMTTAFALMARGEVLAALSAHVLGPPLYAATWLLAGNAAVALVRGGPALPEWLTGARAARWMLVIVIAGWFVNLLVLLNSI
jgi:hypothetical protein